MSVGTVENARDKTNKYITFQFSNGTSYFGTSFTTNLLANYGSSGFAGKVYEKLSYNYNSSPAPQLTLIEMTAVS
jgi:hypothetical protein